MNTVRSTGKHKKFKRLNSMFEGEKFRIAHPEQVSGNGVQMHRSEVYRIDKVYTVEPLMRVCFLVDSNDRRPRVLYPDVPVLLPNAPLPTREAVEADILDSSRIRAVVGYRVHYDGKADLSMFLSPTEARLFNQIYLTGRKEFSKKDLIAEVCRIDLGKRSSNVTRFYNCVWRLTELGLIQPIMDDVGRVVRTLEEIVGRRSTETKPIDLQPSAIE